MKKSDINPPPEYFSKYINLVDDLELSEAFAASDRQLDFLDKTLLAKLDGKRYEADKWTVKEIFQHLIDWERILSFRALLYARIKGSASQSVDENLLAENMNAESRAGEDLIAELKIVRRATAAMFASFDDETLQKTGVNWRYEMSVPAVGFTIIGHQIHHLNIIEEKYLPLINAGETR